MPPTISAIKNPPRVVTENDFEPLYPNSKLIVSSYRKSSALSNNPTYSAYAQQIFTALCAVEDVFGRNLKGGRSTVNPTSKQKLPFSPGILKELYRSIEIEFKEELEGLSQAATKKGKKFNWMSTVNTRINERMLLINKHFDELRKGEYPIKTELYKIDKIGFRDYERYRENPSLFDDLEKTIERENAERRPPDLKKSSRIDPAERSASDDELDKDNKGGLAEDKAMHDLNQLIDSRLAKVPERRLHERLDKRRKDKAAAKLRPFAASGREEESERAHYKRLKKKFAKHGGHRDKKRTKRAEFYDDSSQNSDDLSGRFPREYRAKITSGSSSSESD